MRSLDGGDGCEHAAMRRFSPENLCIDVLRKHTLSENPCVRATGYGPKPKSGLRSVLSVSRSPGLWPDGPLPLGDDRGLNLRADSRESDGGSGEFGVALMA